MAALILPSVFPRSADSDIDCTSDLYSLSVCDWLVDDREIIYDFKPLDKNVKLENLADSQLVALTP